MLGSLIFKNLAKWLMSLGEEERPQAGLLESPPPSEEPLASAISPSDFHHPKVSRAAMGCNFDIYLAGLDYDNITGAAEQALDEISRIENRLSRFIEDSDVTRINAYASKGWVRLEPRLYHLIRYAADISGKTNGAFDITCAPLVGLWGFYANSGMVPDEQAIRNAMESVGFAHILFDDEESMISFDREGMEIDLGAIGKGYAIDEAADTLRRYGVEHAVISGGDSTIYAIGSTETGEPWRFHISDPYHPETKLCTVELRNEALSTSAITEQFFIHEGKRYGHILDPRTGYPSETDILSSTVICASGMASDAYSTAIFLMGVEGARKFCSTLKDMRVVLTFIENDKTVCERLGDWNDADFPV